LFTYTPIDATPFEQVLVVAVATYCTGELTVSAFAGLLTVTFASAGAAKATRIIEVKQLLFISLPSGIYFDPSVLQRTVVI
jgi:hypothetical protein